MISIALWFKKDYSYSIEGGMQCINQTMNAMRTWFTTAVAEAG